jgi:hypothetical protein
VNCNNLQVVVTPETKGSFMVEWVTVVWWERVEIISYYCGMAFVSFKVS